METKVCIRCNTEKPVEEFPFKNFIRRTRQTVCKTCTAENSSRWYQENKEKQKVDAQKNKERYREYAREYIDNYKASHPCSRCGNTDSRVLEFHHRGKKDYAIAHLIGRSASLDNLIAEIAKCDVVCKNCHAIITAEERGYRR